LLNPINKGFIPKKTAKATIKNHKIPQNIELKPRASRLDAIGN